MKNNIDVSTYKFIGDSKHNIAKTKDGTTYTQTDIIAGIKKGMNNKLLSGCKVADISGSNKSKNRLYIFDFSKDGKCSQLIKVIVDSKSLESGDPNALAIDGLCERAIHIKHKNLGLKVFTASVAILVASSYGTAMIKMAADGAKEEYENNRQKISQYAASNAAERHMQDIKDGNYNPETNTYITTTSPQETTTRGLR